MPPTEPLFVWTTSEDGAGFAAPASTSADPTAAMAAARRNIVISSPSSQTGRARDPTPLAGALQGQSLSETGAPDLAGTHLSCAPTRCQTPSVSDTTGAEAVVSRSRLRRRERYDGRGTPPPEPIASDASRRRLRSRLDNRAATKEGAHGGTRGCPVKRSEAAA